MLYGQRNTANGGTEKLRQQQVYSIVYWPPISVHCYPLFGEKNSRVRVDGERRGAWGEGWGGCPRQKGRNGEQPGRKQLMGQSSYGGAGHQPVPQDEVGDGVTC